MKKLTWSYVEMMMQYEGDRSLSFLRDCNFKTSTLSPEKLLRASLKGPFSGTSGEFCDSFLSLFLLSLNGPTT